MLSNQASGVTDTEKHIPMNTTYRKVCSILQSPSTNLRLLYVFSYASWAAWIPFFSVFLKEAEFSGSQIGIISSLIWIVMLVVQPFWGIRADRSGRASCYKISVLFSFLFLVLFHFSGHSLLMVVVCTLFCSFFYVAIQPLLDTLALDHIDKEKSTLTYGNFRFWGAVGASIGSQATSIVSTYLSSEMIFITSAFFLLCCIPFAARLKDSGDSSHSMKMEFKDLKSIISDKVILTFLLVIFFISVTQTSIWYYLTVYMKDIGASDYMAGTAITIDGLVELPFYFLAAVFFRKIGLRKTILFTFIITAIRLFIYSVNNAPGVVLITELTHGLSWALMWVAIVEYTNYLVRSEWRATGQALIWAAYYGAGQIIGNIWTGTLYEYISLQSIYAINGVIVVILTILSGILFYITDKQKKGIRTTTDNGYKI